MPRRHRAPPPAEYFPHNILGIRCCKSQRRLLFPGTGLNVQWLRQQFADAWRWCPPLSETDGCLSCHRLGDKRPVPFRQHSFISIPAREVLGAPHCIGPRPLRLMRRIGASRYAACAGAVRRLDGSRSPKVIAANRPRFERMDRNVFATEWTGHATAYMMTKSPPTAASTVNAHVPCYAATDWIRSSYPWLGGSLW